MKKRILTLAMSLLSVLLFTGLFIFQKMNSSAATNSELKLEYTFDTNIKGNAKGSINLSSTTSSNDGHYDIYWANDSGILDTYEKITTLKVSGPETTSYKFLALNAIPDGVTKVIATQNGTVKAEYKISADKLISGNKKFSFGALSDIHLDGDGDDGSNSNEDFKKELEYFKSQNVAFLANSGDITRDGRDCDVKAVVEKIGSAGFPVYTARGNHDTNEPCKGQWSQIDPNGTLFAKTLNNEEFVFVGMNKYDFKDTFSSEQISQLTNILERNKDKRVFLFEHVFFGSTGNVNGLYPYSGLSDSGTAGQFKELMKKYKNVISFTGHSHLDFNLQRAGEYANVKDKGVYCFRVHCPSASRPRSNDAAQKSSDTYTNNSGALGYLVDVYDNYIVLKGRDFTTNKNLPYATYILYTGNVSTSGTSTNTVSQIVQAAQNTNNSQTIQATSDNANYQYTQDSNSANQINTATVQNVPSLNLSEDTQATVIEDAPATGDESLLHIYAIFSVLSIVIMIVIICIKFKNRKPF